MNKVVDVIVELGLLIIVGLIFLGHSGLLIEHMIQNGPTTGSAVAAVISFIIGAFLVVRAFLPSKERETENV